jgi:peptidoglycan/xylan/chitin deacetylase (PgdA/CDA1 family)
MLIFNLHHVEQNIRQPSRKHITVTPEGLRTFIRTLRGVGMEIVSLREVLASDTPAFNSGRKVLLTFDDGYENNLLEALPVLEEERCPATIFALPGRFGGTNEWDQGELPEEERDRLMTLAQLKQISASGLVTIGSHGLWHRHLSQLSDAEIRFELQRSHDILSQELGEDFLPVFAYPWGDYSERVLAQMEHSPYRYAFTVQTAQWLNDSQNRFEIPRYSIYYRDGNPLIFLAKLCRHGLIFA